MLAGNSPLYHVHERSKLQAYAHTKPAEHDTLTSSKSPAVMNLSPAAITIARWDNAQDWRELLRLNARFIRGIDQTPPYPNIYLPQGLRNNVQPTMLRLQTYGFLVRYLQTEWSSGPQPNPTNPPDRRWGVAQDRSALHLLLPTNDGIPKALILELLNRLFQDQENLEVAVLADWVDYPRSSQLSFPSTAKNAEPRPLTLDPRMIDLEKFRSTVNIGTGPESRQGRTIGRAKAASTKEGLKTANWTRCCAMPYETVNDVPENSKNTRALGRYVWAAAEAKVLEVVVASKKFKTGVAEEKLDLAEYVETICMNVGMEQIFEED